MAINVLKFNLGTQDDSFVVQLHNMERGSFTYST